MLKKSLAVICTVLGLSGCAGVAPEAYRGQTPTLDLATYFNGPLTAWGYFADRSGEVKRRFTVNMNGVWQGNEGVLTENFDWSDGEKSQRIWRITKLDDHRYIGRADDVKGEATGTALRSAVRRLKGAKGARLDFQAIFGSTLIDHLVPRSMAFSQEVYDGLNLRNLTFD
jgi:hypothetical protein